MTVIKVTLLVIFFLFLIKPAYVIADTSYGRTIGQGYFTGTPDTGNGWYLLQSTPNVPYDGVAANLGTVTAQSFISMMQARLNDTNSLTDQVGAAGLIDIMLGKQASDFGNSAQNGINYAQNNFQNFVKLINFYDKQQASGYSVQWNVLINSATDLPTPADNTYNIGTDMVFINYVEANGYAIVFHMPDGNEFFISQLCGNIIGQYNTFIQPPSSYTITGNVFFDVNKNGLIDNGETNYSGPFSISVNPNAGKVTTNPNGTYSITGLPAGTYFISYLSLPNGYSLTYPLNGTPPAFKVTVGPQCSTFGALGALCQ